jgi:hypothetical protein
MFNWPAGDLSQVFVGEGVLFRAAQERSHSVGELFRFFQEAEMPGAGYDLEARSGDLIMLLKRFESGSGLTGTLGPPLEGESGELFHVAFRKSAPGGFLA